MDLEESCFGQMESPKILCGMYIASGSAAGAFGMKDKCSKCGQRCVVWEMSHSFAQELEQPKLKVPKLRSKSSGESM